MREAFLRRLAVQFVDKAERPRDRGFTFDVSHMTWAFPGITMAKFCEARRVAGIKG